MVEDHRESGSRDDCEFAARIVVDPASPATPCLIKDISEHGAKLQISAVVSLPDAFSIIMPVLDEIVEERPVQIRWRRGDLVGVKFIPRIA